MYRDRTQREDRSAEVNRQCCSCMRRFPVIKILVTVVLGPRTVTYG